MNIGYDASGILGQGGIERYARELMRHVVQLDTKNTYVVLTRTRCISEIEALVAKGHNVDVRAGFYNDLMLGPQLSTITQQLQRRQWRRMMSDVDLVHLTNHWRWRPPMKRYVITAHDLFPLAMDDLSDAQFRPRFAGFIDALAPNAAMILTPSDYVAQTIADRYPKQASRIRTTPLAAGEAFKPTPATAELLARAGVAHDERYLLFVGRADDRKNIDRMMQAFLSISEAQRSGVRFVLALSGLREAIAAFKTRNATSLQNPAMRIIHDLTTADIAMLLTNAIGLAFATLAEGFGLPVLEAMQCGCPVLTSNTTSLPEVAGDAALLVDPYDVEAIRHAMLRMIEDEALCADLRTRGFERVKQFSWENTARLSIRAYEEAMV